MGKYLQPLKYSVNMMILVLMILRMTLFTTVHGNFSTNQEDTWSNCKQFQLAHALQKH